jgi:hypothetical protein
MAFIVLAVPMVLQWPSDGAEAVKGRGRALAGFLDRVDREFHRQAARVADAGLDPVHQEDMDLVAGRKVRSGVGDADHRALRLQFRAGVFLVLIAL